MRKNVLLIAFGVAALCAFMLYTRYLRFYGAFVDGRYIDPETGRVFVERAGWMWGMLLVLSLGLGWLVSRR